MNQKKRYETRSVSTATYNRGQENMEYKQKPLDQIEIIIQELMNTK